MSPEAGQSSTVREAVRSFLDDRSDAEETLEAVLEVDADRETWTFEDIPADSGTFGELVSRGIVEKADGEYQVADRDAVAAAISGGSVETGESTSFGEGFDFDVDVSVDLRAMAGLAGALAFLFVMRITAYGSVMREEHVISPGNDPYYFRYWMEELLARSSGPTDWGVIANMPEGVGDARPLSHATNWFVAELLGGGQAAASTVAAWLPVVATLALGVVLYKLATVLTDDPRVGIASVFVLATIPAHAVYTGIGFIDHQIHQYFWLGVMVLSLAWLAVDLRDRRVTEESDADALRAHLTSGWTWLAAVGLGIGVGFSVHAWGGSPLMFIPIAGYLGLRAAMDARADVSPMGANLPILLGLGIGAAISFLFHARWGWHEAYAAYTPIMVVGGTVVVALLGEVWRYFDAPESALVSLESIVAVAGLWLFRRLRPDEVAQVRDRADTLFFREGMTEAQSLFAAEYGFVFGPLTQTGVAFYLALVPLGWAMLVAYRRYEPGWLLVAVCSWYFTVLAGVQMRFTGQLSLFIAVLGGLGLVHVLSVVDLARTPRPFRGGSSDETRLLGSGGGAAKRPSASIDVPDDRGKLGYLIGIFVLFTGLGMLLVPSLVSQVTYSDAEYEAATAIDEHAENVDREYPENFVLSEWDTNRMFNYVVNGESNNYGYAYDNYDPFRSGSNPDERYEQFTGRVGYVVVTEVDGNVPSNTAQSKLLRDIGTSNDGGDALTHYQLLSIDEDRTIATFAVVPGATITGSAVANELVSVSTNITVDGTSFTYEREVMASESGEFAVIVPYAGKYEVDNQRVSVTERDVVNGTGIRIS
ncbi:MFS transporter [Natronoarchaeum mannanilyticum]|uniref:Archaeal glycosylation protein B peripheral domain-containing protein n=1 Tax=Natronoarchaeum mannanilyticum TaxID=926360 RepID=A0AAV3T785_9EURY